MLGKALTCEFLRVSDCHSGSLEFVRLKRSGLSEQLFCCDLRGGWLLIFHSSRARQADLTTATVHGDLNVFRALMKNQAAQRCPLVIKCPNEFYRQLRSGQKWTACNLSGDFYHYHYIMKIDEQILANMKVLCSKLCSMQ